ncbi:MAG TPA: oxygen-independent coproporphyrinogen III oxidase [Campylobacterales bacterium]|nr:oxygen-independent coproporphyrinogen III oxidase [Campylobacterales bacterium]
MIDFDKFVKYSKAGPRYTSYPTAVEFTEKFTETDFLTHLKNSNKEEKALSLYFHLPFCRSACYFCGCNVVFTSKDDKKTRYIEYLKKEMQILSRYLDTKRSVAQLHFGGGTPTFFSAQELEEIIALIRSHFTNFQNDAEISCEIDPRFLDEKQMQVLKNGGFNRVSFGVQDFDEKVQTAVHREQSFELTKSAVELARKYGVNSINMDLIYGLPYQSLNSFKDTLKKSVSLDVDRFAVFNYAHVPWLKKTMRKIDETTLPHPSEKLAILKFTIDYMSEQGYKMIGMDHFAKPSDELSLAIDKGELHRNFQGYTTKGGSELIGVGLTSISELEGCYSQNYKEMSEYEAMIDAGKLPIHRGITLSEDDKIRKKAIMDLMGSFRLEFGELNAKFNINSKEYFKDALSKLGEFEDDELLKLTDDAIEVSLTGRMVVRNIAMAFDAYLNTDDANKNKFSKTV